MIKARDFLSLSDFTAEDIEILLERAIRLKSDWSARRLPRSIDGARIGLIAELPGWRNPTALAVGVTEMGATCVPVTAGLEGSETIEDLAGYLGNWFELLAVRTPSLLKLRQFADALTSPTLNLRTNDNHPCEVLGDLTYAVEQRGRLDGLVVAMVGPAANIARSWAEAASVLPITVAHIAPKGFELSDTLPNRLQTSSDPNLMCDADLIVTDCWPQDLETEQRQDFERYRITSDILDRAKSDVLFVPCPPVTRGEEVSADAMQHPRCLARDAKAFLMHAQNAVVESVLR